ncbi:uncharacterized protein LOC143237379 isoform X2 [Tachypleus tridentatus]|uniref:uncharacterized protein LOC143237379 isoform X2 n=1 Tax=Tachypleus tridentatus TaxID=6853 RepID=UPI003FD1CC16
MDTRKKLYFIFSGFGFNTNTKLTLIQKLQDLGGIYYETESFKSTTTHLICVYPSRSQKFLGACASGIWILTEKFIEDSHNAGRWLPEIDYEWNESLAYIKEGCEKIDTCLLSAPRRLRLARASTGYKAFHGWKTAVLLTEKKRLAVYKNLLQCGGATLIPVSLPCPNLQLLKKKVTHVFVDPEQIVSVKSLLKLQILCISPDYIRNFLLLDPPPAMEKFLITVYKPINVLLQNEGITCKDKKHDSLKSPISFISQGNLIPLLSPLKLSHLSVDNYQNNEKHPLILVKKSAKSFNETSFELVTNSNCLKKRGYPFLVCQKTENNKKNKHKSSNDYLSSALCKQLKSEDSTTFSKSHAAGKTSKSRNQKKGLLHEKCQKSLLGYFTLQQQSGIRKCLSTSFQLPVSENKDNNKKAHIPVNNVKTLPPGSSKKVLDYPKCVKTKQNISLGCLPQLKSYHSEYLSKFDSVSIQNSETRKDVIQDCVTENVNCENPFKTSFSGNDEILTYYQNHLTTYQRGSIVIPHKKPVHTLPRVDQKVQITHSPVLEASTRTVKPELQDKVFNKVSRSSCSELSGHYTAIFESCVEENEFMKALNFMKSVVSEKKYPQLQSISMILYILQVTTERKIAILAYQMLSELLFLHPPVTDTMSSYYFKAFSLRDHQEESPWKQLFAIVSCALQDGSVDSCIEQFNNCLLFTVWMELIRKNFDAYVKRSIDPHKDITIHKKQPLIAKIIWSGGLQFVGSVNAVCRELFSLLAASLLSKEKGDRQMKPLLLIHELVGIVAECVHFAERKPSQKSFSIGPQCLHFVSSLVSSCSAVLEDVGILQVFLSSIQPLWLKLYVCEALLQNSQKFVFVMGNLKSSLSLRKIVTCYFFMIPSKYCEMLDESDTIVAAKKENKERGRSFSRQPNITRKDGSLSTLSKVNRRNDKGETPLHTACIYNKYDKLKKLLAVPGIIVNAQDNAGWTPLHEACIHGHVNCVKELLSWKPKKLITSSDSSENSSQMKVNIFAKSQDGVTPLHDAVLVNQLEIATLLLDYGGAQLLQLKTHEGHTPLDYATSKEMEEVLLAAENQMPRFQEINTIMQLHKSCAEKLCVSECVKYVNLVQNLITSYYHLYKIDQMLFLLQDTGASNNSQEHLVQRVITQCVGFEPSSEELLVRTDDLTVAQALLVTMMSKDLDANKCWCDDLCI